MGYVRAESVRFAAVSNEEMRGEGYTANATGITFIVSQEDLAKVISKMMEAGQRQFPTLLNFPIPKDYPICCTVTYSDDEIPLGDGRSTWIGRRCGLLECDCANDPNCRMFAPPTDVRHVEYWKNKKIKVEKRIKKVEKRKNNKATIDALLKHHNL